MNKASTSNMPRPTIIFDLDDTLVFSSVVRLGDEKWVRVGKRRIYVRTRPGLSEVLKTASKHFDVCFFTAGVQEYGNAVIDMIAPDTPKERRFYRDSCISHLGYMVKDLRLAGRPMDRVMLVDDLDASALLHPDNLMRIAPWSGDIEDRVLENELIPALEALASEDDLPEAFRAYVKEKSIENLSCCCLEEE